MRSYQLTHPKATFKMSINHLMDRRIEEFVSAPKLSFQSLPASSKSSVDVKNLPKSLDWRTRNVTSPVYSGERGTIVTAIVSTELVESLHAIETGNLVKGSISRVYDCCQQPIDAFDCIQNMSGICYNSDYPTALDQCEPDKCKPFTTFDTIKRLAEPDEDTMLAWIQDSTLWAEINVAGEGFHTYTEGIYDVPSCSEGPVNYVVQIVGYGVEKDIPYWLCKNSWSEEWGEKGFFRIARGKNMCNIATVVIQVANSKKSDAPRRYSIVSMSFVFTLAIISRKITTYY
ncbi:unnamed protein product [Adineta steineri]|uniref:Peptidase C1A papain C-terminal domain-containing protein n=4 Tax=Adineta steineri TaxID=433720 RepID=A0A815JI57_9BILA|nr:unnamed protein product [Adineta steineri]CAF4110527.1 unnamed protein product [Adineta steineri]